MGSHPETGRAAQTSAPSIEMRPTIRVGLSESGNFRIQAFSKDGTRLGTSTVMVQADKATLISSLLDCQERAERDDHRDMEWASGLMDDVARWLHKIYELNTDQYEKCELLHRRVIKGIGFEYECFAELVREDDGEFISLVSAKGDSFVAMATDLHNQLMSGVIRRSCEELEVNYAEDEWGLTDRTTIDDHGS